LNFFSIFKIKMARSGTDFADEQNQCRSLPITIVPAAAWRLRASKRPAAACRCNDERPD
jgi:hypothetical protein